VKLKIALIFIFSLFSFSVQAGELDFVSQFKDQSWELNTKNLWITFGLLPVVFFHGVLLHETSHLIMAKSLIPGGEITRFSPYPCRDNEGNFKFGYVSYEYPANIRPGNNIEIAFNVAPYVLDTSAFIVSDILLSTKIIKPERPAGAIVYLFGMVGPLVDFASNFFSGKGDFQNIRDRTSGYAVNVVGGIMLGVGIIRLAQHSYNIFWR